MNKEQLQKAIRTIVQAEVKACLPHLIAEMAMRSHANKQPLTEVSSASGNHIQVQKSQPKPIQKIVSKPSGRHATNPILNQVLSETEPLLPDHESAASLVALMQEGSIGTDQDIHIDEIESTPTPSTTKHPLMRDYSQFLKKMDKAAAAHRPA